MLSSPYREDSNAKYSFLSCGYLALYDSNGIQPKYELLGILYYYNILFLISIQHTVLYISNNDVTCTHTKYKILYFQQRHYMSCNAYLCSLEYNENTQEIPDRFISQFLSRIHPTYILINITCAYPTCELIGHL